MRRFVTMQEEIELEETKVPDLLEVTDCFLNVFKNKTDLVPQIKECINAFEDKRTKKWQAIFDKMK